MKLHTEMRLSVVVPTFNEALHIEDTVSAALCIGDEVIVADGGSADETAELASAAGAHVVASAKGRGAQLNVGAECAAGDVLLFLHADARLPAEARVAIERALVDPEVGGGNFLLRFEPRTHWGRVFGWANDVRRRQLGIYYGDSAIFVRRRVFDALGGYSPLPLLEDFDFVRRLERSVHTVYIRDVSVSASSRRFAHTPVRTLCAWGIVQGLYSLGVPPWALAKLYPDAR
jgi:rSAM/selenodomain-associated transferase 2